MLFLCHRGCGRYFRAIVVDGSGPGMGARWTSAGPARKCCLGGVLAISRHHVWSFHLFIFVLFSCTPFLLYWLRNGAVQLLCTSCAPYEVPSLSFDGMAVWSCPPNILYLRCDLASDFGLGKLEKHLSRTFFVDSASPGPQDVDAFLAVLQCVGLRQALQHAPSSTWSGFMSHYASKRER